MPLQSIARQPFPIPRINLQIIISACKQAVSKGLAHNRSLSLCCLLLLLFSSTGYAQTLVLAQISDRPKKDYDQLRPMAEYLASRMQDLGVTGADVKLFADLPSLIEAMQSGQVHWVTETAYSGAYLIHEANARPLLRKWKKGQHHYQSLIYTHRSSAVKELADLRGQIIAFEQPSSFSGYYLPRMILEQIGLQLQPLANLKEKPAAGKVGYVFSRNEKNNVLWVHKRLASAGSVNDGDWEDTDRVPSRLKADLRILYRSENYPRALELVADSVPQSWAERLRTVLLDMRTDNHRQLLERYESATGFAPVTDKDHQLLSDIYHSSQAW